MPMAAGAVVSTSATRGEHAARLDARASSSLDGCASVSPEVPPGPVVVHCAVGMLGHTAIRLLRHTAVDMRNSMTRNLRPGSVG